MGSRLASLPFYRQGRLGPALGRGGRESRIRDLEQRLKTFTPAAGRVSKALHLPLPWGTA